MSFQDSAAEMTEAEKARVDALARILQKLGMEITGCGCCGSPALDVRPDKTRNSLWIEHFSAAEWLEYRKESRPVDFSAAKPRGTALVVDTILGENP